MYPHKNYSIRDDKLKLIKKYVLLGSFYGANQYFWIPYILFNYAVIVGQLIYLYQVWGNLTKMMGMTATFTIEFQATYKLMLLYWKLKQIRAMHKNIENDFWDFDVAGKKLEIRLDRRMTLVTKVLCMHLFSGIFGAAVYMAFPLTKYPPGTRQLPIQCWFPFDTNPSPLHEFVYFVLASNGIICIISIGLFDFTFIYFAQHLLGQFDLLKKLLKNLTRDVMNNNNNTLFSTDIINLEDDLYKVHSEEFQKEIYRRMSVCVEHHSKLLSFGRELEKYSSVSIAIQLFVSMMTFVIIGFILSTDNEDFVKSFKLGFYFVCVSLQLGIFALHGSELQYQSLSVATSAYFCEWYLGKGSLRTGLVFLQMNAQKEIKISAVGCVDLNNNTFVSVYRTAFSCVTLLQSLDQN